MRDLFDAAAPAHHHRCQCWEPAGPGRPATVPCTAPGTHWLVHRDGGPRLLCCEDCGREAIAEYDAKMPDDPRMRFVLVPATADELL